MHITNFLTFAPQNQRVFFLCGSLKVWGIQVWQQKVWFYGKLSGQLRGIEELLIFDGRTKVFMKRNLSSLKPKFSSEHYICRQQKYFQ